MINISSFVIKTHGVIFVQKQILHIMTDLVGVEIDMGLIVVGKDFWLERHEYDGSEWWEFKSIPMEPEETIEFDLRADYSL
jgi:hypothetical protein